MCIHLLVWKLTSKNYRKKEKSYKKNYKIKGRLIQKNIKTFVLSLYKRKVKNNIILAYIS